MTTPTYVHFHVTEPGMLPEGTLVVLGSCGCGHLPLEHGRDGCIACPCITPVSKLVQLIKNVDLG